MADPVRKKTAPRQETIARLVQRLGRGIGLLMREITKTDASDATVPLQQVVLAALERRRREQSAEMLRAQKLEGAQTPNDDHFYWRGDDVRPGRTGFISRRTSEHFSTRAGSIVGSPPSAPRRVCRRAYTFHRLRHDYASILLKQCVKDRVTQEMLRHAQYTTTESIYQPCRRTITLRLRRPPRTGWTGRCEPESQLVVAWGWGIPFRTKWPTTISKPAIVRPSAPLWLLRHVLYACLSSCSRAAAAAAAAVRRRLRPVSYRRSSEQRRCRSGTLVAVRAALVVLLVVEVRKWTSRRRPSA
jgi:hypothetical protein